MAAWLWVCCRSAWGRIWDEWASAGDLWGDAPLVGATFSRDAAGLFSAGERDRDGRDTGWRGFGCLL